MEKPVIKNIGYHPTFNCNLSCRGCINYSDHLETRKIPDEINWSRDLDILFERFDVHHIDILGGETLMFTNLKSIIEKLTPARKFTISTNGLLLDKNLWLADILYNNDSMILSISVHADPMVDTIYIDRLCNSVEIFFNMPSGKFKRMLRRARSSPSAPKGFSFNHGKGTVRVKDQQNDKWNWRYPKLDNDELPVLFNNDKHKAYSKCVCPYPHIKNGKIYKCPMTAMLPLVIDSKGITDPKWDYLKEYVPYDLISEHNSNLFKKLSEAEDVCCKCPYFDNEFETEQTDLHSKIVNTRSN